MTSFISASVSDIGFGLALPFRRPGQFLKSGALWIILFVVFAYLYAEALPTARTGVGGRTVVPLDWPLGLSLVGGLMALLSFLTSWSRVAYFFPEGDEARWLRLDRYTWTAFKASLRFMLVAGLCGFVVAVVLQLLAWGANQIAPLGIVSLAIVPLFLVLLFMVYSVLVMAPISAAVDDDPRGVFDTWGYANRRSVIRTMIAIVVIACLSGVVKATLLHMVANVPVSPVTSAILAATLAMQAYGPALTQAFSEIPLWLLVLDVALTCLTIAATAGALASIYRGPRQSRDDVLVAEF
jgi:hypothetical protein